jgi:hypothetical protein
MKSLETDNLETECLTPRFFLRVLQSGTTKQQETHFVGRCL